MSKGKFEMLVADLESDIMTVNAMSIVARKRGNISHTGRGEEEVAIYRQVIELAEKQINAKNPNAKAMIKFFDKWHGKTVSLFEQAGLDVVYSLCLKLFPVEFPDPNAEPEPTEEPVPTPQEEGESE